MCCASAVFGTETGGGLPKFRWGGTTAPPPPLPLLRRLWLIHFIPFDWMKCKKKVKCSMSCLAIFFAVSVYYADFLPCGSGISIPLIICQPLAFNVKINLPRSLNISLNPT